ncbi:hypothetical protein SAY86_007796 [Trapa natans]|uniref:Uncharacterized protein n=1 Tax=Trapa natans TaxID=22666 RepID=A0AAN7QY78_TRANT|nr:hypothetical protein SAY86_007796 [Trapa natans]
MFVVSDQNQNKPKGRPRGKKTFALNDAVTGSLFSGSSAQTKLVGKDPLSFTAGSLVTENLMELSWYPIHFEQLQSVFLLRYLL